MQTEAERTGFFCRNIEKEAQNSRRPGIDAGVFKNRKAKTGKQSVQGVFLGEKAQKAIQSKKGLFAVFPPPPGFFSKKF